MNKSKKVLITGASGFIGKNLIEKLADTNSIIATIDLVNRYSGGTKTVCYEGDIRDYSFVESAILDFQPEIVYHLAGYKERIDGVEAIETSLDVNLTGTLNIFKALLKNLSLELLITLGSMDEYGEIERPYSEFSNEMPVSSYGFGKLCATKLASFFYRNYNLPVIVLRPSIVYGPYQEKDMFIPSLINAIISDDEFLMTPGEQNRDFIYVQDLIGAMLSFDNFKNYSGQVFNIGSGRSIKIKAAALMIGKLLEKEYLIKVGHHEYRKNEIMNYATSIEKAKASIDWSPLVSFEEGISLTIKYFQNKK